MLNTEHSPIQLLDAAIWLAEHKTEKTIITNYYPPAKNYIKSYFPLQKGEARHRDGTLWVRGELAYTADRALRLCESMFSEKALKNKVFTIIQFQKFCENYFVRYRNDDMSCTRLHYFIASVRKGDIHVHRECRDCFQPYVTHKADSIRRVCGVCMKSNHILESLKEAI